MKRRGFISGLCAGIAAFFGLGRPSHLRGGQGHLPPEGIVKPSPPPPPPPKTVQVDNSGETIDWIEDYETGRRFPVKCREIAAGGIQIVRFTVFGKRSGIEESAKAAMSRLRFRFLKIGFEVQAQQYKISAGDRPLIEAKLVFDRMKP